MNDVVCSDAVSVRCLDAEVFGNETSGKWLKIQYP